MADLVTKLLNEVLLVHLTLKLMGQAVLSPLITPDSSNAHGDNGTTHGMNKGKQDQETEMICQVVSMYLVYSSHVITPLVNSSMYSYVMHRSIV